MPVSAATEAIDAELKRRASKDATPPQPGASVDWAEMRALYCKGISLTDLARKFGVNLGTIKARSSREKWRNTVAKVNDHVLRAVTTDLTTSAQSWITRIDKTVHGALDNLTSKGIEKLSLRDLQVALDCADKANRIARQTYGLDQQSAQQKPIALQVNVHAHTGSLGTSHAATCHTDVIDVSSGDDGATDLAPGCGPGSSSSVALPPANS